MQDEELRGRVARREMGEWIALLETAGKVAGSLTAIVVPIAGLAKWRAKRRREAEARRRKAELARRRRDRALLRRWLRAELRAQTREVEARESDAAEVGQVPAGIAPPGRSRGVRGSGRAGKGPQPLTPKSEKVTGGSAFAEPPVGVAPQA